VIRAWSLAAPISREGVPRTGRAPYLRILIVVAGVLLLVLALTLHQVGMDHSDDMDVVGACIAVLAATILFLGQGPTAPRWPLRVAHLPNLVAGPVLLEIPRWRPPPPGEGTVLLC
jgi:hypothetical protein